MTTWQVEFRGIDVYVKGEYIPEGIQVPYDSNMEGHPGNPEGFEVDKVYIENTDVTFLMEEHMEELERLVLEVINSL